MATKEIWAKKYVVRLSGEEGEQLGCKIQCEDPSLSRRF
jgi:hypothetical protein